MVNLVVNAREAMPAGGKLTLRVRQQELSADQVRCFPGLQAGLHLVLEVEDDGIGVPEQVTRGEFPAGVGLPGIRERLDALAGDLSIGRAEKGTRLVAAIPWQRVAAAGVTVR